VLARRRFQALMVALAGAALLALPAAAQATPRWFINGVLAGSTKQNVVAVGTLTMDNKLFGEWKCKVLAGLAVGNESEKGTAQVETWEPFDCSAKECQGVAYVTAEVPPEELEPVRPEEEIRYPDLRRRFSTGVTGEASLLPWPSELISDEAGKSALKMRKMKLFLGCPAEAFVVPFGGYIEPPVVNGVKNGLNPSHIVFEGKGGHTSYLVSPDIEGGKETENSDLFFSGELTTLGTGEELITAE
jgi:hypothetical protein